ncbi:D-alanyl-D-alanine carboxypeptidase family protein [Dokdonella sp. MW10]|uniref:D-alanyl-D-alanine carboxypeptidase family protein n=1 Tax=Dokdonella sp. MW10 TaxID=2992926 RepID=UPI003F815342
MRHAAILALACWLGAAPAVAREPVDAYPDIAAAYWVEVDDTPLWAGKADQALPIASLTKLMTALVAVEHGDLDAVATVSRTAAAETGSRLGLRAGERIRRSDLLAALLVRSANDACRALADDIGGDEPRFIARMNARAAELGMARTRFANACGHDDDDNRSSVRDLAVLARAVLAQPVLAADAARTEFAFATLDGRRYTMRSTNALLGSLDGARGLKTGWTPGAGRCLVAFVERDGRRVLAILLHAPDRWWDSVGVIELAFAQPRAPR